MGAAEDAATATPLGAEPQMCASMGSRLPIDGSSPVVAEGAELTRSVVNLVALVAPAEASTVQRASMAVGNGSAAAAAAPKPRAGQLVQQTEQRTSLTLDDRASVAWATLVASAEEATTAAVAAKAIPTLARRPAEAAARVM